MMTRFVLLIVAMLLPYTATAAGVSTAPASGRTYAIILAGAPGEPLFARNHRDWAQRFATYLRVAAGNQADIALLCGDRDLPGRSGDATLAVFHTHLARIAAAAGEADQFILILIGHAMSTGALSLSGEDLEPEALAEALKPLQAGQQVIFQFSGSSGAVLKPLAAPGRVVITSTSAAQASHSDFAEFFLLALEGKLTDTATRPSAPETGSRPSLLRVFNIASHEYAQWITRQRQGATGWMVEGRQSREIFQRLYSGDDVPPGRRLAPGGGAADDAVVPISPSEDANFWNGRRLVTEVPQLEDTGAGEGVAAIGPEGYKPLAPAKSGDPGWIAREVMLVAPTTLAPEPSDAR
jgi:hypothetical protein